MKRLRSSMLLLAMSVVALLIGTLRVATERPQLPTGSSYSTQPDGAQALYEWADTIGARPLRLVGQTAPAAQAPATLLVLQPETTVDAAASDAFAAFVHQGGTLVLAGDSVPWLLYARTLGVTIEPIPTGATIASTPEGSLAVHVVARYRLRADQATPLLVTPSGDWLALRMPAQQGSIVVLATPQPLTNAALADPQDARFVYREVMSESVGQPFVVDEAHHSFAPAVTGAPATLNQLVFETAPGRAVLFAAVLTFLYILLSGRRLGPALAARPPSETHRTMYEHVQMLANLYRRAGQFGVVQAAFSRQLARSRARSAGGSPKRRATLASALVRVEAARDESELVAAVASAQPEA